ncbi:MAG: hypothetical protein ABI632_01515 [Pseudolysinimonas sp.]
MFKKILAGVVTAVLSLGVVALVAGPASAHHNTINPKVTCATDGRYLVTWSVSNSESGKTEVITVSSNPDVVAVGTTFGFLETKTFVQYVTEPQNLKLDLTGFWDGDTSTTSDDVYTANSGQFGKDSFPTGCLTVTPSATPQPSVCDGPNHYTDPTYTIVDVTGIKYTVGGVPTAPGVYPATNGAPAVHIEASVTDNKYKLIGTAVWDFTFTVPTPVCTVDVDPVTPDFKQQVCTAPGEHSLAQYFIPTKTGIIYSVKIDGGAEETPTPGWHDLANGTVTVQIIARGDTANYYVLKGGTQTYDYTVNDAGKCLHEVTPKTPTVSTQLCDVENAPGVVPPTTYTLDYVEHVVYQVSIDGVNYSPVTISGNTTFTVSPGTHIYVKADVDDATKYQSSPFFYDHQFVDPGDCKGEVTPVTPSATDQFCDDGDLSSTLVQGTITIFPAANIEYFLDGVLIEPGTHDIEPGDHTVTVQYDHGKFNLATGIVLPFELYVSPGLCLPTEGLVEPAVASSQIGCFSNGSYTLSNDQADANAVIWTVNGSQVAEGKYTASGPGTVTITAAPNAPAWGFQDGIQTTWTVDFKKPSVCDIETLALTGQSPTGLLIAADLLVVAGLALFATRAARRGRSETA